jgi:RNA polymerase sigma-70 factor, ECF subfamily
MSVQKSNSGPYLEALLAHSAWVRQLARAMAATPDVADDVEQEAWRVALERPPKNTSNLRAWWARVVRSSALQRHRSESRYRTRVEQTQAPSSTVDKSTAPEVSARMEDSERLARLVNELPSQLGTVLFLRFFEEKSVPQIAKQLNLPQSTVKSRLKRGLEHLRSHFQSLHGKHWRTRCLALTSSSTLSIKTASTIPGILMSTKAQVVLCLTAATALAGNALLDPTKEAVLPEPGVSLSVSSVLSENSGTDLSLTNTPTRSAIESPELEAPTSLNEVVPQALDGIKRDAFFKLTALEFDGSPTADLHLDFTTSPDNAIENRYYRTDENGVLEIPCISGEWNFRVVSDDRDGGNSLDISDSLDLAPGKTAEYTVRHPGWNTMSGVALDFEDKPLENFEVQYWGKNDGDRNEFDVRERQKTNAAGEFEIDAINGKFTLVASTPNGIGIIIRDSIRPVHVNEKLVIRFPKFRTVDLYVKGADSKPISGARVDTMRSGGDEIKAPDGREYASSGIGSLSRKGHIRVDAPTFIEWPIRIQSSEYGNLFFNIPPEVKEYHFEIDSGLQLKGRVVDQNGRPIPGASIRAWAPEMETSSPENLFRSLDISQWYHVKSGRNGEFNLAGLAESHDGHIFVKAKGMAYFGERSLKFSRNSESLVIKLQPELVISGRLLDANDQPVESRTIQIEGFPAFGRTTSWMSLPYFADTYRVRTGSSGHFSFHGLTKG